MTMLFSKLTFNNVFNIDRNQINGIKNTKQTLSQQFPVIFVTLKDVLVVIGLKVPLLNR